MRIQHNISALNAYNNYTANSKAMSNSLEKLSSGYKINRAGDDAAGLAISEKMRAQIKGMETAKDNANDGISLIQTAEGALTEVHSMLNRMVQLATQSANGTYDNETDRVNLQAEVNQLQEEIDRISKSTNYNGINLLDGTQAGTAAKRTTIEVGNLKNLKKDNEFEIVLDGAQSKTGPQKLKFTVDLSQASMTITGSTATNDGKITLQIGENGDYFTLETTDNSIQSTMTMSGVQLADQFMKLVETLAVTGGDDSTAGDWKISAVESDSNEPTQLNGDGTVTIKGVVFNVKADGGKLIFEMQDYPSKDFEADLSVEIEAKSGAGVELNETIKSTSEYNQGNGISVVINQQAEVGKNVAAQAEIDLSKLNGGTGIEDGTTLKIGNDTYIFAVGKDSEFSNATGGKVVDLTNVTKTQMNDQTLMCKLAANALSEVAKNNSMFQVTSDNQGKVGLTERLGSIDYQQYDLRGTDTDEKDGKWGDLVQAGRASVNRATEAQGGLTMQIGDTPDSFNKLTLVVDNMSSISLGVGRVDISTQEGAAEAIDKIKAAINKVSTTRGTMGAIQNRLEYTINNLNAGVENMTAAESRIRDVDMAKEMTEYTKNNILLQASQAMLAQANQLPQGVLQLLQ